MAVNRKSRNAYFVQHGSLKKRLSQPSSSGRVIRKKRKPKRTFKKKTQPKKQKKSKPEKLPQGSAMEIAIAKLKGKYKR